MSRWHKMNNAAAGAQAVIIGKGPSLDAWIAAGRPQTFPSITIGLNHAAAVGPCDYGITTHGDFPEYADIRTRWIIGLPLAGDPRDARSWRRAPWVHSWFIHTHAGNMHLLGSPREEIAESRMLWGRSNSGNNAIHLAWYLGASSLMFVGCEGTPEYARACSAMPGIRPLQPMAPAHYPQYRIDNEAAASVLFDGAWHHWTAEEQR